MKESLNDPNVADLEKMLKGKTYRLLCDMADVVRGLLVNPEEKGKTGKYLLYTSENIVNGSLATTEDDEYVNALDVGDLSQSILRPGDLVVSLDNSLHAYLYKKGDPPTVIDSHYAVIRSRYSEYIMTFLTSKVGQELFLEKSQTDVMSLEELKNIKIPILNIADLNSISNDRIVRFSKRELVLLRNNITKNSLQFTIAATLPLSMIAKLVGPAGIVSFGGAALAAPILTTLLVGGAIALKRKKSTQEKGEIEQNCFIQRDKDEDALQYLNTPLSFEQEVLERLKRIEAKVDKILEVLITLQDEILLVKSTQRTEEEKIKIISNKIDIKLKLLTKELGEEMRAYKEILKDSITNWQILDELSMEMLLLGEYLFDKVKEIDGADYSPVILQFCRSLENEMLKKIFIDFTININSRFENLDQFNDFFRKDFSNFTTKNFISSIKKYRGKNPEEIQYTLGTMIFILDKTRDQNVIDTSPLIKEFKDFLLTCFKNENILLPAYLREGKVILHNFRNKSAHPHKLTEDEALECKKKVPSHINHLIDSYIVEES